MTEQDLKDPQNLPGGLNWCTEVVSEPSWLRILDMNIKFNESLENREVISNVSPDSRTDGYGQISAL